MRKVCSVDGCARNAEAKGWCFTHYQRWRRHGDPLAVKRRVGRTESERFWQYVDMTGPCWLWTGAISHEYGSFFVAVGEGKYKQVLAHRWAYTETVGPIPDGLVLDHLCRVKNCVKPQHLQPVRQQVNVLRGKVARALRENACINGHKYTPENTHINKTGARQCRICSRASVRKASVKYRAKKKAEREASGGC